MLPIQDSPPRFDFLPPNADGYVVQEIAISAWLLPFYQRLTPHYNRKAKRFTSSITARRERFLYGVPYEDGLICLLRYHGGVDLLSKTEYVRGYDAYAMVNVFL